VFTADARRLSKVIDDSVALVVTSPPYPMIEMWDSQFMGMNPRIGSALAAGDGGRAYDLMHSELAKAWDELGRVVSEGGFVCINVGDATRSIGGSFQLYPNHVRVAEEMRGRGFSMLPSIIWRKQTNKPNKYMGSGMLPGGAYVTLEHEFILVFRKGKGRAFGSAHRKARQESSYFWEERNTWFSDVWWDLKGTGQSLHEKTRPRSGAFPFELPYRLISMYSVTGDTVLDPFLGTGTTMLAAVCAGRSSIGCEIEPGLRTMAMSRIRSSLSFCKGTIARRLGDHVAYVRERRTKGKRPRYSSRTYGFPVVTRQETEIVLPVPWRIRDLDPTTFEVLYR
jgi:DNA modification methylase